MSFHPSKGYNWKQNNTEQQKKPGLLRAQETMALRHWMDRTIEMSAVKVVQSRQAMDQNKENSESTEASSSIRGKVYFMKV